MKAQIEELRKDLCNIPSICNVETYTDCKAKDGSCPKCRNIARDLYDRGYRKQSEWISVEEKLPSQNGVYRVRVENYGLRCLQDTHAVYVNGVWVTWQDEFWRVTHWIDPFAGKGE